MERIFRRLKCQRNSTKYLLHKMSQSSVAQLIEYVVGRLRVVVGDSAESGEGCDSGPRI